MEETPGKIEGTRVIARWRVALLVLATIGIFAAGFCLGRRRAAGPPEPGGPAGVARLVVELPADAPLAAETGSPALAIAPSGERLVYVARRGSRTQLYRRDLDQLEASALPRTDGASAPFFSPGGDWVAFFADGRLKKVPAQGGEPVTLCEAGGAGGGSWGPDDTIYFVPSNGAGLFQVPASGGRPGVVSAPGALAGGTSMLWPEILPGGRALLCTLLSAGRDGAPKVGALRLATAESAALVDGNGFARYASSGHLLCVRGGALIAAPFDPVGLRVTGKPVQVLEGILADPTTGAAQYAVSASGTLVYAPSEAGASERALLWVDREGVVAPLLADRRDFDVPRVSPDGRYLAVSVSEARRMEVWIFDVANGSPRRLPSQGSDGLPLWGPGSASLTYVSLRAGAWNIFRRPAGGDGVPELLASDEHPLSPSAWSPDGRALLYTVADPGTRGDIWMLTRGRDSRPRPLIRTAADEWGAVFSPDGRFIAYTSDESGRNEVYLRPYPGPGERRQLSTAGGYGPVWNRSRSEVFFRSGDTMMTASVSTRPALSVGAPSPLFDLKFKGPSAGSPNYDATPDGRRFVLIGGGGRLSSPAQIHVVLGWLEEMKRRVAAAQD
ncbi:MAG: hypothetical protein AUG09_04790 [Acidobacteria bacterium 13_1_20CM_2_68_7]|nr:MAG: hypothetical protein AUG09_04790 [Acidobacteria bacterium 13_1_20CM_2_68_7]